MARRCARDQCDTASQGRSLSEIAALVNAPRTAAAPVAVPPPSPGPDASTGPGRRLLQTALDYAKHHAAKEAGTVVGAAVGHPWIGRAAGRAVDAALESPRVQRTLTSAALGTTDRKAGAADTLVPGLARGAGYLSDEQLLQMARVRALRLAGQPDQAN